MWAPGWSVAQKAATHGPVLHRCMRSAVGNWKAEFKLFLFHLNHIKSKHHTHSKSATLHQRSPDTREAQPALRICTEWNRAKCRDAVTDFRHVSFTLARACYTPRPSSACSTCAECYKMQRAAQK